jgi:DNA-binding NarL/FixJ family response regulator
MDAWRSPRGVLNDHSEDQFLNLLRRVGEASNFLETIEKTMELSPDVIVLDLYMPDRSSFTATELKAVLKDSRVVAICFGVDDEAEALAQGVGAVTLLDKMVLSRELVLTILQLGSRNWESISAT